MPFPDEGKQQRILALVLSGVETAADIEVDMGFTLTRHQIAGHLANLLRAGKIRKVGEFKHFNAARGKAAYRYGPPA